MKMTVEEKARAYDESLEKARKLKDEYNDIEGYYPNQWLCEELFPELRESEDERIRKELISFFTERAKYTEDSTFGGLSSKEIIAWLEKQGKKGANGNDREISFDAWSEEDEKQARQIERIVHDDGCTQKLQKQIADWLKSLKDRCTWKPSDGQMEVLNWCKPLWNDPKTKAVLESLIEQLKKLREE